MRRHRSAHLAVAAVLAGPAAAAAAQPCEPAPLVPVPGSPNASGTLFAHALALDGRALLAGAPGTPAAGINAGAGWFANCGASACAPAPMLIPADAGPLDQTGTAVAFIGDRLLLGAPSMQTPNGRTGAAVLYERTQGTWTEHQAMIPAGAAAFDGAGTAVALGTDAALITRPGKPAAIFTPNPQGDWQQTATIPAPAGADTGFGAAAAMHHDLIAIGAPRRLVGNVTAGAVTLVRGKVGAWSIEDTLEPPMPTGADAFGSAIAVLNDRVAIGAPGDDALGTDAGAVFVFRRAGPAQDWQLEATIHHPQATPSDRFGVSVALAEPGRLLVGTNRVFGTSDATLFSLTDDGWALDTTLEPPPGSVADAPASGFGRTVALSADLAAIGAPFAAQNAGAAYVFDLSACGNEPCLADVNGNGVADPGDFTAWIAAYNQNLPAADQNQSGAVEPGDFTAWIANYNAGC